jgi:signal transduction histidine kinase
VSRLRRQIGGHTLPNERNPKPKARSDLRFASYLVYNSCAMRPSPSVLDLVSRRLALPGGNRGLIETERVLAAVRVVLVLTSLVLVGLKPEESFPFTSWIYALLILYLAHSIGLLLLLRARSAVSSRFSLAAHAADILWPAVVSLFAGGFSSPFFLYFIFALLAAAFRWGMRETLLTTFAVIITMAADAIAITKTPLGQVIAQPFDVTHFILRSVYLAIFSFLIGYISESEKRRAAEALSISRVSSKVRVEGGLKGTAQNVFGELLALFGGRELLIVNREAEAGRVTLWRSEQLRDGNVVFTWRQLDPPEEQAYFFAVKDDCAGATWRHGNPASTLTIDAAGAAIPGECRLAPGFVARHSFRVLLGCAISAAPDVSARVLLIDPQLGGRAETQLRFLQDLVNLLAPSIYNVYLLRRLRSRAAAVERARVSRELHDGVVQSLHAIAFRLYALRTRAGVGPGEREQELLEIQQLVQNEAANVRHLIQQLEPLDFDPRHLADFLAGMVTRYRQDTGIGAQFVCDVANVILPPATSREIAGIVREALANVRRHSGAQNVLVRLLRQPGCWMLIIEDDGRGFQFSGRFSHAELEEFRRGPLVIKQRVRAIEGELTIISKAGQGARLEVKVPDIARATSIA